jgi:hypothetical protein
MRKWNVQQKAAKWAGSSAAVLVLAVSGAEAASPYDDYYNNPYPQPQPQSPPASVPADNDTYYMPPGGYTDNDSYYIPPGGYTGSTSSGAGNNTSAPDPD